MLFPGFALILTSAALSLCSSPLPNYQYSCLFFTASLLSHPITPVKDYAPSLPPPFSSTPPLASFDTTHLPALPARILAESIESLTGLRQLTLSGPRSSASGFQR